MKSKLTEGIENAALLVLAVGGLALPARTDVQPQIELPVACVEGMVLPLAYGSHVTGCTTTLGDTDLFTFEALAGDVVRFLIDGETLAFDPRCQVFGPSGLLATQFCDPGCCSTCTIAFTQVIVESGTHTVILSDQGDNEAGSYGLQIERIPAASPPPVIGYDQAASTAVSPTTDHDHFRFYAQAGSLMHLVLDGQTLAFDPKLEILDPTGAIVETKSCDPGCCSTCTVSFDFAPTSTGWHGLVVSDSGSNEIGDYNLSINCFVGCPQRVLVASRNGSGANPAVYTSPCPPNLGGVWQAEVDTSASPGAVSTILLGFSDSLSGIPTGFGELLINIRSGTEMFVASAMPSANLALYTIPVPDNPSLAGVEMFTQCAIVGPPIKLTNAIDITLGF